MRIGALKAGVRRIWVEVDGEPIWVDYKPGELTLEINDKIKEAIESGLEADIAQIMLEPLVVDWDLEDEVLDDDGKATGEVVHLTPEAGLKKVPLEFLGLVLLAVKEDSVPNRLRDGNSVNGSQPVEQQVPVPSGISISGQQTDSESPSTDSSLFPPDTPT